MKFLVFLPFILISPLLFGAGQSLIEIPSTFNPTGSGARALGMGGAFISTADDASAASWNPSALIQLRRPEIALVLGAQNRQEDLSFGLNPESNGKQSISNQEINYFSLSYPCHYETCGKPMVFSLSYQTLYNMDRDWAFSSLNKKSFNGQQQSASQQVDFKQEGGLHALAFAYAVQINRDLSLGLTLNIWNDFLTKNGWSNTYHVQQDNNIQLGNNKVSTHITQYRKDNFNFKGINANFGLLWKIFRKGDQWLTLGLVLKTPFTADLTLSSQNNINEINNGSPLSPEITHVNENQELKMPLSYGIGLSYNFSNNLVVAADLFRTEWDHFELKDAAGERFSPISNLPLKQSNIDATYQARLGMEYRLIGNDDTFYTAVPLRAGLFYDQAPSEGESDNFYGFSLGAGIGLENMAFDIAYQYRWGQDVSRYILPNRDFSQDVAEHTLYASLYYYF